MIISTRRVVVTGIGAITPLGSTITETWQRLLSFSEAVNGGQLMIENSGITSLELALKAQQLTEEQFEREWAVAKHLPCQVAAAVQHSIPHDGRTSRFVQFALHAAKEAAMQAQLYTLMGLPLDDTIDFEKEQDGNGGNHDTSALKERTGVCIGTGMSSVRDVSNSSILLYNPSEVPPSKRIRTMSPYFVPKLLPNSASGRISVRYKLGGPVLAPTTACAAGAHAIGDAFRCILHNDADIMIAGGSESCIDPISMTGFCRLRAMSTNFNGTPALASRPFDSSRDGFVMGEGAAILVLEEREHALQRGVPILCELGGYGLTGDGYHMVNILLFVYIYPPPPQRFLMSLFYFY
jgi:3-oxoacyl-[acyl-carrier-protein] synthase II